MINRCDIENRIRSYQFALYDLALYQDSHPDDHQAQQLRTIYRDRLKKLIDQYEQSYGQFVQTQQDVEESWKEWVSDPWPWDNSKGGN